MEHDAAHGPCPPPRDSRDTSPGPQGGAPPRVWALIGPRRGDAAQVRALVADLGLPAREIRVETNALREVPNALLGATRALLRDPQAGLVPPWPELVVGIGRRTVPLARWIRARSGGRTRLIHLGRPRAPLGAFDTVLSTAQYALPPAPGVVMLALPWQAPLSEPPASGPARHVVAVLGGDSWSVRLTGATVDALVARARAAARARGLPLVATTAPRTPPALAARLAAALGPDERLYDWAAAEGRDNPYRADLAGAGEIVTTGDSASVLADAAWTGRPVTVIPAPERAWLGALARFGGAPARLWRRRGGNLGLGAPPPDLGALLDGLAARGLARFEPDGACRIAPCRPALEAERRAVLARLGA